MKTYELPDLPSNSMSASRLDEVQIEAARYAVLRRLSPSLRHHLIRPLQPITLIYGVLSHKLSAPSVDAEDIRVFAVQTKSNEASVRRTRELHVAPEDFRVRKLGEHVCRRTKLFREPVWAIPLFENLSCQLSLLGPEALEMAFDSGAELCSRFRREALIAIVSPEPGHLVTESGLVGLGAAIQG